MWVLVIVTLAFNGINGVHSNTTFIQMASEELCNEAQKKFDNMDMNRPSRDWIIRSDTQTRCIRVSN